MYKRQKQSRSPASVGPIPARALSGSRAAAEWSDPELRSFPRILWRRRDNKFFFYALADTAKYRGSFAPQDSCCCCYCCCDLGLSLSFAISSNFLLRGRNRVASTTSLRGSPSPYSTPSALPASVPAFPAALGYEYSSSNIYEKLGISASFPGLIQPYYSYIVLPSLQ